MKPTAILPPLLGIASLATGAAVPREPSQDDAFPAATQQRIPTSRESAVLGRRILALTPLGTLSTVFPASAPAAPPGRPDSLAGVPLGLVDYIADCEESGNPTILAVDIATHFRNVRAGSNISLAVRWAPPRPPRRRIGESAAAAAAAAASPPLSLWGRFVHRLLPPPPDGPRDPVPYSAANLPRFSLTGYLEAVENGTAPDAPVAGCFVAAHPDARYWLPGNRVHRSHFVRLVVTGVYWVGGFGDRAYIGWIPVEEWAGVAREEWEAVRLPGEEGEWDEWSAGGEAAGEADGEEL